MASGLYWYITLFIHSGIGQSFIQKKEKQTYAQNSNISQSCGVLSKVLSGPSWHFDCQMLYCGACSRAWKREFPFAGMAESSTTALSGHPAVYRKYLFTLFSGCGCDFIFLQLIFQRRRMSRSCHYDLWCGKQWGLLDCILWNCLIQPLLPNPLGKNWQLIFFFRISQWIQHP